jgi:hypothetical protein
MVGIECEDVIECHIFHSKDLMQQVFVPQEWTDDFFGKAFFAFT